MPNLKPHSTLNPYLETSPTSILRFLDQIDISLWACSTPTDEITTIDSIASTFTSDSACTWYRSLVESLKPRRVTLNDLRRALLNDFGIDNWETVMERYKHDSYWESQEFMLKLSYLDEIEGLKDQIKFRDKKALEDREKWDKIAAMWEEMVAEKDERIRRLETMKDGRRWEEEEEGVQEAEGAFSRFERSIEAARERFREELGIIGCGDKKSPYPSSTYPPNISSQSLAPKASDSHPKLLPNKSVHWPTQPPLEKPFEPPFSPRRRLLLPRMPLKPLKVTNAKTAHPSPPVRHSQI